jgi:hypothetical protein
MASLVVSVSIGRPDVSRVWYGIGGDRQFVRDAAGQGLKLRRWRAGMVDLQVSKLCY